MITQPLKIAIIVVDFQNDFITGSLALNNGSAKQEPIDALCHINRLLKEYQDVALVVYSRDNHPPDHISFFDAAKNKDRELSDQFKEKDIKMFDTVEFKGKIAPQVLYPAHCVVGTEGAELHKELTIVPGSVFINKGEHKLEESYSAFRDNDKVVVGPLLNILRDHEVNAVIICGIAYDICVAWTARDAVEFGFKTAVAYEGCKGLCTDGIASFEADLEKHKIAKLSTSDAIKTIKGELLPEEWK